MMRSQHACRVARATADKNIDRLEEFGPACFILAQATGITPNEYRRIRPAVHDQKLFPAGPGDPDQRRQRAATERGTGEAYFAGPRMRKLPLQWSMLMMYSMPSK